MEGWRQRRPGSNEKEPLIEKEKTVLTRTGLLMEGVGLIRGGRSINNRPYFIGRYWYIRSCGNEEAMT